ncbi:MAG: YihY/virulence factor BrkB family protein [Opitutaceae bacterium]|nr:YihY/virulence factor BrkB family protein [Opitutaceae bacterium]
MTAFQDKLARLQHFFTRSIWQAGALADRSLRGRCMAALRIAATTVLGVVENSLPSRAGALSYSSMLALGPLIILVVLFTGSIAAERVDRDLVLQKLNEALRFVAPQLEQAAQSESPGTQAAASGAEGAAGEAVVITAINPQIEAMLRGLLDQSNSKAITAVGIVSLVVIVIQLFTSIETAFNDIWGVRRGRNWVIRVVYYWSAITLGAILLIAAFAVISGGAFASVFGPGPEGGGPNGAASLITTVSAVLILVLLLTVFYKFIPNTSVAWFPSFVGAVIVVGLIYLNNTLAFLYIRSVKLNLSIYGGLGVLVVMMLGLYVFWLILLLGGQITYAVQNAHYRGSNIAWADLTHAARLGLAVLVLTVVARRFRACQQPFTAAQIAEIVKVPIQVLNACFMRLLELGVISRIPTDESMTGLDYRFQPARPLGSITLAEFKELFETSGEGPRDDLLGSIDPVVKTFFAKSRAATQDALGGETLEQLIARLPDVPAGGAAPARA